MAARVRKRWLWAALVLTLLALGPILNGNAARSMEADLQAIEKMGVPRDSNALMTQLKGSTETAGLYRRLKTLFDDVPDSYSTRDAWYRWLPTDGLQKGLELRNPFAKIIPVIEETASGPPPNFQRNWNEGAEMLVSENITMRDSAKIILPEIRLRAANKDLEGALTGLRTIERLADHAVFEPSLIGNFVSLNIESYYWLAGREILTSFRSDRKALSEIESALDSRARLPDLAYMLTGEFSLGRASINSSMSIDYVQQLGGGVTGSGPNALDERLYEIRTVRAATERKYIRRWRELFDSLRSGGENFDNIDNALVRTQARLEADNTVTGRLNQALWPPLDNVPDAWRNAIARRRHLQVAVRLLLASLDDGRPPSEIPNLGDMSVDPFSGKPFVYKPSQNGFLLYGVGIDRTDDGGDTEKWRDMVFEVRG